MSALIYGIIDAVNIGLNAHYDAVTSVVLWIYNVAVTIGHALQQSYDSMVVAYDVLRTLIIDLVGHAILFAKLTLYVIHRMSLAVQFVFLIIDNLIILVSMLSILGGHSVGHLYSSQVIFTRHYHSM